MSETDILQKIKEKEEVIGDIETTAQKKIEAVRKKLDSEYSVRIEESNKKKAIYDGMIEKAVEAHDTWKEKLAEIKYKVKNTGQDQDILDDTTVKYNDAKARMEEVKMQIKVFSKVGSNFEKEKLKMLKGIEKQINGEKKTAISNINKEIKTLKKELAALKKAAEKAAAEKAAPSE